MLKEHLAFVESLLITGHLESHYGYAWGEPKDKGGRDSVVVPISNEAELYYYDWVEGNIKKVSDATDGKVGYVHIPDMLTTGLDEFAKHFYIAGELARHNGS